MNRLLLSEFAKEDGFELNRYIARLFECFSSQSEKNVLEVVDVRTFESGSPSLIQES